MRWFETRVLQLRCKACHMPFESGIVGGETRISKPVLGETEYRCPHCGRVAEYTRTDYFDPAAEPAHG